MSREHSFFAELRRRHIFRIAAAYAVTAWLLIQLAAIALPAFGAPHWIIRVVIGLLILFFPVALILAWAFEATPEGIRRSESARSDEAASPHNRRRTGQVLNIAIIVILAAAVGVLAWRLTSRNSDQAQTVATGTGAPASAMAIPEKSIAVLPFENLSTDKNNGYFADGIQDLILSKLAEIGGLTVISRTSTMRYQSHPGDLKAIGQQLGVTTLLEGSVQKAGDEVLINVQLIDARTDHHLWAKSYTRTLNNVFGVEGEVAEKVAAALKQRLDPAEQARVTAVPTRNPAAYDAYLRGLSLATHTNGNSPEQLAAMGAAFRKAVKLDPGFALAWARLSSIDGQLHFGLIDYTPARLAQAKAALDKARALAPNAVATRIAMADYAYYGRYDFAKALAAYRKVLEIAPNNAYVLASIGYVERRLGHWQRAIDYLERSLALDPRNVNTLSQLGWSYAALRRYAKAREYVRQALAINPDDIDVRAQLANIYQNEGNLVQAGRILVDLEIPPGDRGSFQTGVFQALFTRRYADAVQTLRTTLRNGNTLSPTTRSTYYRILGFAERLSGHGKAARQAYAQALDALQAAPESPIVLIISAMAEAGLGHKAAALAAYQKAMDSPRVKPDAYQGRAVVMFFLAVVQAQLGEKTRAIDTLGRLLARPPGSALSLLLTPATLRFDPTWDPLRKEPAFQALLKQYPATPGSTSETAETTR